MTSHDGPWCYIETLSAIIRPHVDPETPSSPTLSRGINPFVLIAIENHPYAGLHLTFCIPTIHDSPLLSMIIQTLPFTAHISVELSEL